MAFQITPEQMTIIINCQNMREKINPEWYHRFEDFKRLARLSIDELRDLQDHLIKEYNNAVKK